MAPDERCGLTRETRNSLDAAAVSGKAMELDTAVADDEDDGDEDEVFAAVTRWRQVGALIFVLLALGAVGGLLASSQMPVKESFCTAGASFEGSAGATNGLDRRSLSSPSALTRPPPKGFCEEVYASALGHAVPDCSTGKATATNRPDKPEVWWKRWGESVEDAVDFLAHALNADEKEQLLRGFGWKTWTSLPGHYIGNTLAVPRLGVPSINMQDAGSGFRTVSPSIVETVTQWPSLLAVSASWDDDLTFQLAAAIGREFRRKGANVVLGPGVNVQRVARNGRNAEYISGEEPALGARLAAAYVRGVQSEKVAAVVKHFVLNNQESERTSSDSIIDDRTLWEIYYPPFEAAISAGAASVMCSYNRVNSVHACTNSRTLTKDLRENIGFSGWVMSDWWAAHDVADMAAGLDQIMPGNDDFLEQSTFKGLTSELSGTPLQNSNTSHMGPLAAKAKVDQMARRVLRGMIGSGAWDQPTCTVGCDCQPFIEQVNATSAQHRALARDIAAASAVLLKNEGGALPLSPSARIGLVGSACSSVGHIDAATADWRDGNYYGIGGSGRVIANHALSLRQALQLQGLRPIISASDAVEDALALARGERGLVDVVVACAGASTTESKDRDSLELDQHSFIHALAGQSVSTGTAPLIVLALAPGQFVADWAVNASAVVAMFLSGEETGTAAADVLLGRVNPSAKLPVTLPLREEDMVPPCLETSCQYTERLLVGWRALHNRDVAFPFGHGLSYTSFEYAWVSASEVTLTSADIVSVYSHQSGVTPASNTLAASVHGDHPSADFIVRVTNVGARAGSEVVQLYLEFPPDSGEPPLVLSTFSKTRLLEPGESISFIIRACSYCPHRSSVPIQGHFVDVELSVSLRDLSFWSSTAGMDGAGGWHGVLVRVHSFGRGVPVFAVVL